MSEFIDREKAIENIKAAYCCGCENYNGVRCRACQIMDAMDVLEDEPAVVPDVQRWRKTAEEPPTEKDSAHGNVLVKYMDATFAQSATWDLVASAPDLFTLWMPMPKLPGERPKKLYWREKACKTICPICGYECNDDYYLSQRMGVLDEARLPGRKRKLVRLGPCAGLYRHRLGRRAGAGCADAH